MIFVRFWQASIAQPTRAQRCHENLVKLKGYAESRFSGQSHSSCRGDLSSQRSKVTSYKVGWEQLKGFVFFIVPQRITLVSNAKRKILKSNKSELWNRLSYRGLPYFLRLAAKLSEMITKFWGCNLKIQHRTSCDLNSLKKGLTKFFENNLKSMQIFQILIGGMNVRERSQKN